MPAYRGIGAFPTAINVFGNTLSPGDPTGLTTGDIQILIESLSGFGTGPVLPTFAALTSGWTQILQTGQTTNSDSNTRCGRIRVSWALDTATDPSSTTNVDGSNLGGTPTATNYTHQAVRLAVSASDLTTPVQTFGGNYGSGIAATDSFSMSGITTTTACLIIAILVPLDDNSPSSVSLASGPTLTQRGLNPTTVGGDQTLAVYTGVQSSAGATGNLTASMGAGSGFEDPTVGILLAIQDPVAASGRVRGRRVMMLGVG